MNPFTILFIFFIGFYITALILILFGLFRLNKGDGEKQPFISVIIAARNEEKNLPCSEDVSGV